MKILTVIGARPQFIKAATVSRVIVTMDNVTEMVVHTGQHFDANMSDIFFEQMDIPKPDYNLEISSLSHGAMTGRMLEEIEGIIINEKPDWVLVYGDTNSTLAGALAASKLHVKVAHVEAGLRSFNMRMPEEQNRIITDRLSSILFCPTAAATVNLDAEGYKTFGTEIINIGDVMFDAAMYYKSKAEKPAGLYAKHEAGFILATVHRAENTDDVEKLTQIVSSLNELNKSVPVILPLHPRTRNIIEKIGIPLEVDVIEPVGYLEMIYLLQHCQFVASDSGGVQKEAYFFNKHCLVLREETEWMELVEAGANFIVGSDYKLITSKGSELLSDKASSSCFGQNLYGTGDAARLIVDRLICGN